MESRIVLPEWHLKQSWYSAVGDADWPSTNVYVGWSPAGPLTTESPEIAARAPDGFQGLDTVAWLAFPVVAACALWQSMHSLCRFCTPVNSSSTARVCASESLGSWE